MFVFGSVNLSLLDLKLTVSPEIEIIQKKAIYSRVSPGSVSALYRLNTQIKENFKFNNMLYKLMHLISFANHVKIPVRVISVDDKYFFPF